MKKISTANIEEAVKRLADTYQPFTIYLFGSYAWGQPHEDSDLDFMIVVNENTEHTFELRRKGNRALAGIGFSIDFLCAEVNFCVFFRVASPHQLFLSKI